MGITHVVNASQGTKVNQTDTNADYYQPHGIDFHGVPALDIMTFKILPYLRPAAEYIHQARQKNGELCCDFELIKCFVLNHSLQP
jgi:dual specificity phosphatase 3